MNSKDVIYVDVDDEITNVIDKVNSSTHKIVALVLPKRATVFQSIVNMKLLKRKADDAKKNVVLVTSEAGLMPLAGAVGLHVAKTLEAKPAIPDGPKDIDEGPVDVDDDVPEETIDNTDDLDKNKSIGELAGAAATGAAVARTGKPPAEDDAIEIDNDKPAASTAAEKAGKKAKKSGDKKFKIPDFNKFRNILIIGGAALILLIVFFILAFKVWPQAHITIQTNTSNANTDLTVKLDSTASSVDPTNLVLPARLQTDQKTAVSPSVTTTGQKTVGTPASGSITVSAPHGACTFGCPADSIPSGTVFTDSSGNFSFQSTSSIAIPACSGSCKAPSIPPVPVTATAIGSSYNLGSASGYTSSGSTANGVAMGNFSMSGSTMTGGSSQNVQVVSQADLDSAQKAITAPSVSSVQTDLSQGLTSAGFQPVSGSYVAGNPTYTPSAALGTQANSITVTESITYTMYGVRQNDLQTLIDNNVDKQIDVSKQSILNSGASNITFTIQSSTATAVQGTLDANSTIGPKLDINSLKQEVAGQRSGDIKSEIGSVPGVTNVTVKYSPFWVSSTPKNTHKINITIQKANGSAV